MKFWRHFSRLPSLLTLLIASIVLFSPHTVLAAAACTSSYGEASMTFEYVNGPTAAYQLEQPFGGATEVANIGVYIQLVYQFALGLVSIIAVVLIMIGGLRWIVAGGNESSIGEAKEMIISAVMGLVIALLSYTILQFINPDTLNLDSTIAKIPLPIGCGEPDPVSEGIPNIAGLNGNGASVCPNVSAELQRIATAMRVTCPTCTINVGSGLRTHEKQAELYSCYIRAKEELGVTDGSKCPSDCSGCNLAAQPCCSNHEDGKAVDLSLDGANRAGALSSSSGFAKTYNNNGAGGGAINETLDCATAPNPGLCINQQQLREIMTKTTGTKFKGISAEWWHYDYTGDCTATGGACTSISGYADNAYCKASGESLYIKASCGTTGKSTCPASGGKSWAIVSSTCAAGQHVEFSTGQTPSPLVSGAYTAVPNCV